MATWSFDDSWTSSEEIESYFDRSLSRSLSLPFFFITERLQLQLYTSKFPDEFLEKILSMKDFDAPFIMSLPSTLHAMFADSYIDKVKKITASKLIAAAVETLWQTIVRLANENISDRDLLEIFANQFQCLIAQSLDIIRHTCQCNISLPDTGSCYSIRISKL